MNAVTVASLELETETAAVRRLFGKLLSDGFQVTVVHVYRNAVGQQLYRRIRFDHPDGRKEYRPLSWDAAAYVAREPQPPPEGKPLYRLPELSAADPAAIVWIVEGEKAADALAALGLVVTTSGSASSANAADWTPCNGRTAILWPDNDRAGSLYADAVAGRLRALGCTVDRVDVAALGLPEKGDCVDWLALHPTTTVHDLSELPRVAGHPARSPVSCAEDGAAILDDVHSYIGRFVAYPNSHARIAHTLWIAHTHLMDAWDSTPRIAFLSPEPGSGKSRALEVTETLVPRAVEAVNVSPAYLFRKVAAQEGRPTILYDEIDTVFGPKAKENEEIRGLLNAGHRKHSKAGRCVVRGKEIFTEEIPAYCAVALAGLGGLPDTILTRCVIVRMRRRAPSETVEPYRRRVNGPEGERLGQRLAAWSEANQERITGAWPTMPDGIHDRDADVWEALLMVADAAGGTWPAQARAAAVALVAESRQITPSLGVQLLADLRRVFASHDALATETILAGLVALTESPWGDLRGKPLDARGLSRRLKEYDITPKSVRIGATTPKGYSREDLHDAWERYLPSTPAVSATTATNPESVAPVADVAAMAERGGTLKGEEYGHG